MQQQWMEMVNHVVEWGKEIPWSKGFQGAKETVEFACSCLEFILFAKTMILSRRSCLCVHPI